jgi:hypothetical protein
MCWTSFNSTTITHEFINSRHVILWWTHFSHPWNIIKSTESKPEIPKRALPLRYNNRTYQPNHKAHWLVVCFLNSTAANGNRTASGLAMASKLTLILRSNTADCHFTETYRGFHQFLHGGRSQDHNNNTLRMKKKTNKETQRGIRHRQKYRMLLSGSIHASYSGDLGFESHFGDGLCYMRYFVFHFRAFRQMSG